MEEIVVDDENKVVAVHRDKSYRYILCVLITFIFGIVIILLILNWSSLREKFWSSKEETTVNINDPNKDLPANVDETLGDFAIICSTLKCKSSMARMWSLVNVSINPCEDFYKFSCSDNANAHSSDFERDLLDEIRKIDNSSQDFLMQYKEFYTKCLNFEHNVDYKKRYNSAEKLFDQTDVAYWSLVDKMQLEDLLSSLLSQDIFYFMAINSGFDKSGKRVLELTLPVESEGNDDLGLWSNRKRCLSKGLNKSLNHNEIYKSFLNCLADNLDFKKNYRNALEYTRGLPDNETDKFTEILKIYPTQTEIITNLTNKNYVVYTVEDLNKLYKGLNWLKIFKTITGHPFSNRDLVHVYFPEYFKRFFKLFDQIENKNSFLASIFQADFYYNYAIPTKIDNVQTHCLKKSIDLFKDISSYLYLQRNTEEYRAEKELLSNKFRIFREALKNVNGSREFAENLDEIRLVFASASEMPSQNELKTKYVNLDLNVDYVYSVFSVRAFQMDRILDAKYVFGHFINTFDVNPVGIPELNTIFVPLDYIIDANSSKQNYVASVQKDFHLLKELVKLTINTLRPEFLADLRSNLIRYPEISISEDLTVNYISSRILLSVYRNYGAATNSPMNFGGYNNLQVMFIALAQEFCESLGKLEYAVRLFDGYNLPNSLKINIIFKGMDEFINTFNCYK